MDSIQAIRNVEADLRLLIRLVLGNSWLSLSSRIDGDRLERKVREERGRRPASVISTDLLEYTELQELITLIIDERRADFAPALGTKKHIETYLAKIAGFRNPTMHTRQLLPFEEHLATGISGELRNRIAIYRNVREEATMFWPVVESVTDSFGNEGHVDSNLISQTGVRLEIGDIVSFRCRGTDPEGRELTWVLTNTSSDVGGVLDEATGDYVELVWSVTKHEVGETSSPLITMRSSGPYHRTGRADANVMFHYAVNPPRHTRSGDCSTDR